MKMDSILLMAYVDGELSAEECQEVEKEIAVSPDAAEFVAQLQTARLPYAEAFAQQKLPPVPDSLTSAVAAMARAHEQRTTTPGANDAAVAPNAFTPPSAPVRSRLRIAPQWLAVAFVAGLFCYGVGMRFLPGVGAGSTSMPTATPGRKRRWRRPIRMRRAGSQRPRAISNFIRAIPWRRCPSMPKSPR
jgi:anti-sigma factor RsiW